MIIVFDLDGTLINSELRHQILLARILKEYKISYEDKLEGYLEYKKSGNGNLKFLQEVLNIDKTLAYEIQKKWMENIENREYLTYDKVYPEVIPILNKLYEKDEIYYLTARSNRENLLKELEYLQIEKYAQEIFVVNPKKAIEEKRKIITAISRNGKTFLIGDTEVEYEAGKQLLSVYTKILNRGFRNKEFFESKKIKTYNNLCEIFKEVQVEKC